MNLHPCIDCRVVTGKHDEPCDEVFELAAALVSPAGAHGAEAQFGDGGERQRQQTADGERGESLCLLASALHPRRRVSVEYDRTGWKVVWGHEPIAARKASNSSPVRSEATSSSRSLIGRTPCAAASAWTG